MDCEQMKWMANTDKHFKSEQSRGIVDVDILVLGKVQGVLKFQ